MYLYYCFYQNCRGEQKERVGHRAAYALLSYGLKKEYGIFALPDIKKGRYGKPYFAKYPQIFFNISHCDGMAACVIAKQEIGIDVERKRRVTQAVVKKSLTQKEREQLQQYKKEEFEMGFLRYWTLKESFIKAIGRGLSFPLCEIEFQLFPALFSFSISKDSFAVLEAPFFISGNSSFLPKDWNVLAEDLDLLSSNQTDWRFFQTIIEKEYLLSVCFREGEEMEKVCCLQEIPNF